MKKALLVLLFGAVIVAINTGCQKKRGCTDTYSDNFDPEAELDDDTCIPTRLKFVGEYDGHGTIEVDAGLLEAYDQVAVNVQDSTAFTPDGLVIGISDFDAQLYALSATVTGTYNLMINSQWLGDYNYSGTGSVSGRVLELDMTRIEKIEIAPEVFEYDTLYLNLYGIKELEP
jgi:hypothetical protein